MAHAPGEDPLPIIEETMTRFAVHPQHRTIKRPGPESETVYVLRWMLADYHWMIAEIKRLRTSHKAG